MNETWIKQSITAGGKLTIESVVPGKCILRARMDWPGEDPVVGGVSLLLEDALQKLDLKLMEDCAREMRDKGAA